MLERFDHIADLYAAAGVSSQPIHPDFDLLNFHQLKTAIKPMMPPHRRGFCTIIFIKDQKSGRLSINQEQHQALHQVLLFQGTEHIFSFVRDADTEGWVLLFKAAFLLPLVEELELAFPFFGVLHPNLLRLSMAEQQAFEGLFQVLEAEQTHRAVVKPLLVALLEKAKQCYQNVARETSSLSKPALLAQHYKKLIAHHFIEQKQVGFYAKQLHVSANYLNEVVKAETGISAKKHISARVVLEAHNLLRYTHLDISEISHLLSFSEPTHFTKFFKKETGLTPKTFQQQKP